VANGEGMPTPVAVAADLCRYCLIRATEACAPRWRTRATYPR